METAKVSVIQLFSMMFLFELGSALVVSLGSNAGKDAWFAILLGLCGGMALFFMYSSISHPSIFVSGNVDIINLQPFLENGWKPIISLLN
jgi:spore germination protein KB